MRRIPNTVVPWSSARIGFHAIGGTDEIRLVGMIPSPTTIVPVLVLFIVFGLVLATFPVQMIGYLERLDDFVGRSRISLFSRSVTTPPMAARGLGVVTVLFAAGMLALYLWQLWHQVLPQSAG